MTQPIRVFIGTESKTEIARKVLECSIRRRTQAEVEFTPMIGPEWEYSTKGFSVGTGFSLRRWMIANACKDGLRAIYMDADQIVFGDVAELWAMPDTHPSPDAYVWCTYQPDKYSPDKPVPQSSVMVIDVPRAMRHPQGYIDTILVNLRNDPTRRTYDKVMHLEWSTVKPVQIDTAWNHLNVFKPNVTKLLHYTKEPEQPWYKPDHPLAKHWQHELEVAIKTGYVGRQEFEEALSQWGKKEDWRNTNGLHPYYRKYLSSFDAKAELAKKPTVLWVTSCGKDMWEASGKKLVESFIATDSVGHVFVALEGAITVPEEDKVTYGRIDHNETLTTFLRANRHIIPESLGGSVATPECQCFGGPFKPHDKGHVMPCIGHWFNKNMSRWFRKIVAQRHAIEAAREYGTDRVIWVDSDCVFTSQVTHKVLDSWFPGDAAFFYLKNKRPIVEAGVLGFDLTRGGDRVFDSVLKMYESNQFRKQKRWDDSAIYQWCIDRSDVKCVDLATAVGAHAGVVEHSPLAKYLVHRKGHHSRGLGIMT